MKSNLIASIGTKNTYFALNMGFADGGIRLGAELCEYSMVMRKYVRGAVAGTEFFIENGDRDDMRGLVEDCARDIRGTVGPLVADVLGEDNPHVIRDRDFVEAALMAFDGEFDFAAHRPVTAPVAAE